LGSRSGERVVDVDEDVRTCPLTIACTIDAQLRADLVTIHHLNSHTASLIGAYWTTEKLLRANQQELVEAFGSVVPAAVLVSPGSLRAIHNDMTVDVSNFTHVHSATTMEFLASHCGSDCGSDHASVARPERGFATQTWPQHCETRTGRKLRFPRPKGYISIRLFRRHPDPTELFC
jgi:hypothetical protein